MIWPAWQYPHCTTSTASHAFCTARPKALVATPSMVVIGAVPTDDTCVTQDRTGALFKCTVQAPQKLLPQPNLVPFKSSKSRSTQSNGICGSASTSRALPLIRSVNSEVIPSSEFYGQSARGSKLKSRFI